MNNVIDRVDYSRQQSVVGDSVGDAKVAVIGVGAVGRQVALQLGAMGIGQIELVDFDKIENHNICNQGWNVRDVGRFKVAQVRRAIEALSPRTECVDVSQRVEEVFMDSNLEGMDAVFCCVDSMETRKKIVETVDVEKTPVIDARMIGEHIEVRVIKGVKERDRWLMEWFPSSEAAEATCGSIGTIYSSNIAGGLMLAAFVQLLRGAVSGVPYHVECNLAAWYWSCGTGDI